MKTALGVIVIAAAVLMACDERRLSEELSEPVIVREVIHTPTRHGSGLGVGISTSGNVSVVPTSVTMRESFTVVFECAHGKFIVNRRDVWEKVNVGDHGVVYYREVYHVKDTGRTLVDYSFVRYEKAP